MTFTLRRNPVNNAERAGHVEIHTLKVGGELTDLELMCIRSWIRLDYRVYVHSYDEIYLPAGANRYDANLLMPKAKIFRNKRNGSLAVFADVYRATMLTKIPALWLDTDIFLVRAFDFSCENILACENGSDVGNINNALLKLTPDSPILKEIIRRYENPYTALPWDKLGKVWQIFVKALLSGGLRAEHLSWGALGYLAIQKTVRRSGFDGQILGPEHCLTSATCPLFDELADPDQFLAEPVFYVHFHQSNYDLKKKPVAPNSIMGRLLQHME